MSIPNFIPNRVKGYVEIAPVDNDGTLINGVIIDRLGYQSAILELIWAASSGTPTTATAAVSIYYNSTSSTSGATKLVDLETALNVKTAGYKQYDLDLSAADRYVYAVVDITYADGTTPKNIVAASLVLGDKSSQPANSATVYGR